MGWMHVAFFLLIAATVKCKEDKSMELFKEIIQETADEIVKRASTDNKEIEQESLKRTAETKIEQVKKRDESVSVQKEDHNKKKGKNEDESHEEKMNIKKEVTKKEVDVKDAMDNDALRQTVRQKMQADLRGIFRDVASSYFKNIYVRWDRELQRKKDQGKRDLMKDTKRMIDQLYDNVMKLKEMSSTERKDEGGERIPHPRFVKKEKAVSSKKKEVSLITDVVSDLIVNDAGGKTQATSRSEVVEVEEQNNDAEEKDDEKLSNDSLEKQLENTTDEKDAGDKAEDKKNEIDKKSSSYVLSKELSDSIEKLKRMYESKKSVKKSDPVTKALNKALNIKNAATTPAHAQTNVSTQSPPAKRPALVREIPQEEIKKKESEASSKEAENKEETKQNKDVKKSKSLTDSDYVLKVLKEIVDEKIASIPK